MGTFSSRKSTLGTRIPNPCYPMDPGDHVQNRERSFKPVHMILNPVELVETNIFVIDYIFVCLTINCSIEVKYESQSLPFVHTLVTRPNDREGELKRLRLF